MNRTLKWATLAVASAVGLAIAADEITVTATLKAANGYFSLDRSVVGLKIDQTAGAGSSYNVQSIQSNAVELVAIAADVTTRGWSYFRNLTTNATDYVDLGPTNGVAFLPVVRLYAGEIATFPAHPTTALWAKSGTTSTNVVTGINLECWINER